MRSVISVYTILFSASLALAQTNVRPKDRIEEPRILLIGPFLLGDLYAKMPDQLVRQQPYKHLRELLEQGGAPSDKDVVKALNGCKITIIDEILAVKDKDKVVKRFSENDSFPRLVIEGKLSFDFKGRKGKNVSIHLMRVKRTNVLQVEEESRNTDIYVHLRLRGAIEKDCEFNSQGVTWTPDGKVTWTEE